MALSKLKCTGCKERFTKESMLKLPSGNFHSYDCATIWSSEKARKAIERQRKKQIKEFKAKQRAEHKEAKERIKSKKRLEFEAKKAIQKYVRLRDYYKPCVSCEKTSDYPCKWDGSHFYEAGKYSRLKFNLWNIHKACGQCNTFKGGNLIPYGHELENRIGKEKLDWMKSVSEEIIKYDREYLIRLKQVFNKRCKILEKRIKRD